jgi:hypothetical protein
MAHYLVESYAFTIDFGGRSSQGVVGEYKGSEKIYLHVLEIGDADVARLATRVDDDGNKQHDRLALPREEWWVAVEGEVSWPKVYRPKLCSRCENVGAKPKPVPLSADDIARLKKSGVGQVP